MDGSRQMNQSSGAFVWFYLDQKDFGVAGGMLTPCLSGETEFIGLDGLLLTLDSVFDEIEYPQRYMARCRLGSGQLPANEEIKNRLREPVPMPELLAELEQHEGEHLLCASVRVEQRKHATWQGALTLPDRCDVLRFQSAMELMRILQAAVSAVSNRGAGNTASCGDEERVYEMHWA